MYQAITTQSMKTFKLKMMINYNDRTWRSKEIKKWTNKRKNEINKL